MVYYYLTSGHHDLDQRSCLQALTKIALEFELFLQYFTLLKRPYTVSIVIS